MSKYSRLQELVIWQAEQIKTLLERIESLEHDNSILEEEIEGRKLNLSVLKNKPHSEISKLKLFIEIFNALSGEERNDVSVRNLIDELVATEKFSMDEAMLYLKKASQHGQLIECKPGFYKKV